MATDAYGNPNGREDYLAFGEKTRGEASVNANQNWFIGKPQDATTGLVYFGARWYDPSVPRFLSFDPAPVDEANPHSFNRYAYGNNNPNTFLDPDGRNPLLIAMAVGAVAGGTISGTINGVAQYATNGSVQFGGANGVFAAASEGAMIGAVFGMAGGAAVGVGSGAGVIAGSIRNVNPTGGRMNCVNCAVATDATLAGRPASALPGGATPISILEAQYGGRFSQSMSPAQISEAMSAAGNGARGIVFGSRGKDVGHVFNVTNQNGTVRYLDGQTGKSAKVDGYESLHLLKTE